ncbi:MAG: hypothetical protein ACYDCI_13490 [Candidatus Limnocylindrales bacterium]
MVELDAYAADCRVYGRIDLGEARLTDLLTLTPELLIRDARLESLDDGHAVELPELMVHRDELCAVVASGPRGDTARRLRTRATRVELDIGPYHVEGSLHGTPAAEPLGAALRRAAWVPLTEVTLTYVRGADDIREDVATLLINHDLVHAFRVVEEVGMIMSTGPP